LIRVQLPQGKLPLTLTNFMYYYAGYCLYDYHFERLAALPGLPLWNLSVLNR
jgi:hypothetical protein